MKKRSIFVLAAMALLLVSCAVRQHLRHRYTFLGQEVAGWQRAAVEAASSPEEWVRVGGRRLTAGTLELDTSGVEFNLDCPDPSHVEVTIPCLGRRDRRSSLVRVTVARDIALVVSMKEELWP